MPLESPARLGLLSLVAGGALVAGCAGMGGVQGRLEPAKSGRGAYENTVVYLVAKEPEKQSGHPKAEIVADGNGFTPDVLAVAVGTKVTFHNKDRVFHNAFSISPAKRFDVGAIAPGDRRTVVFDHAGVVSVFCELHPKASATIVVVPTRRFAMVDETGSFHFSGVPKGAYTLKSWHPDRGESKVDVQMPEHGDIQVTLPYQLVRLQTQWGASLTVARMLADPLIKGWSGSSLEAAARVEAVDFDRSIAGDDRERLSATLNFRHRPWVVLRAGWYYEVRHDRFANPTPSAGISLTASSYF